MSKGPNTPNDGGIPKLTPEQLQQLQLIMAQRMQAAAAGGVAPDGQNPLTHANAPKKPKSVSILGACIKYAQGTVHGIDRFMNFIVKKHDIDRNDVVQTARGPILFGMWVILIFVVGGGLWSAFAPLDTAATAVGTVIPSSKRKIVQHLTGGIVKEIYVQQGEEVKKGQPLIELDSTRAKAEYEIYLSQYRAAEANEDRLIAERDGLSEIPFDENLLLKHQDVPEVAKLIHTQTELFKSRQDQWASQVIVLEKQYEQIEKSLALAKASLDPIKKAASNTAEQYRSYLALSKDGFISRKNLLDVENQNMEAQRRVMEAETKIAQSETELARVSSEIASKKSEYTNQILQQLKEAQNARNETREKYIQAEDAMQRIVVRSPVDGRVIDLNVHTKGGVINAGAPIAEISPDNDMLIVEAKIPQKNIGSVHVGLVAKMRFSAFKSRTTPVFTGRVISLSPDTIQDRQTAAGMNPMSAGDGSFYVAKIEIDMNEFNEIADKLGLKLYPGMSAEVQIVTGTKTLLQYLLDPITDNMFHAFKEK